MAGLIGTAHICSEELRQGSKQVFEMGPILHNSCLISVRCLWTCS